MLKKEKSNAYVFEIGDTGEKRKYIKGIQSYEYVVSNNLQRQRYARLSVQCESIFLAQKLYYIAFSTIRSYM